MTKRGATMELNHDNWDDEYEEEQSGTFKPASSDIMMKRKIKTAKRRSNNTSIGSATSPFSNFTGFKPQTPSSKPFFDLTTTNSTPTTNGADEKANLSNVFNLTSKANIPNSTQNIEKDITTNSSEQQYVSNMISLNKKVSAWITLHVEKNPLCILTPVFNDYERYLKDIKDKRILPETKDGKNEGKSPLLIFKAAQEREADREMFPQEKSKNESLLSGSTSSLQSSVFSNVKAVPLSQSVLLKKPDPASLMVNPFTTKLTNTADKSGDSQVPNQPKPFSFGGSSQPFTFANVTAVQSSNDTGEQVEESDEPPKDDFKPIKEEGALFSKRCKVFVKKDSSYADRGVGTLYVKKVGEEKYQLLVRADTVLGNILVNVLLSNSIPTKRMGKNNVMLVCLPTPDANPPPTTVLLRVKTSDEADDLLKTLEQYKN